MYTVDLWYLHPILFCLSLFPSSFLPISPLPLAFLSFSSPLIHSIIWIVTLVSIWLTDGPTLHWNSSRRLLLVAERPWRILWVFQATFAARPLLEWSMFCSLGLLIQGKLHLILRLELTCSSETWTKLVQKKTKGVVAAQLKQMGRLLLQALVTDFFGSVRKTELLNYTLALDRLSTLHVDKEWAIDWLLYVSWQWYVLRFSLLP